MAERKEHGEPRSIAFTARRKVTKASEKVVGVFARIFASSLMAAVQCIRLYRKWTYDPIVTEQEKCPGCGHKSCRLEFIITAGAEKGAIQCTCNFCSAKFYKPTVCPVETWLPKYQAIPEEVLRRLAATQAGVSVINNRQAV